MSLRAILEVVVHLDTFRNIDLFFQGLYYVKVSVYNKKGGDEVSKGGWMGQYRLMHACLPVIPRNILIFIIHSNLGELCESVLYFYVQNARGETEENEQTQPCRPS